MKGTVLYDAMMKVVYAKTPNPTEDVPADYYLMEAAEKVLESVGDDEIKTYIRRYLNISKVREQ